MTTQIKKEIDEHCGAVQVEYDEEHIKRFGEPLDLGGTERARHSDGELLERGQETRPCWDQPYMKPERSPDESCRRAEKSVIDDNELVGALGASSEDHTHMYPSSFELNHKLNVNKKLLEDTSPDDINKDSYNCDDCSDSLQTVKSVAEHRKNHASLKSHECADCDKAFVRQPWLERHRETAHGVARTRKPPNIAPESILQSYLEAGLSKPLPSQLSTDHEMESQKDISQTDGEACRVHIAERESPKKKFFVCSVCPRKFVYRKKFKEHKKLHMHWASPHRCQACGNYFQKKSSLERHERKCPGLETFECPNCGKCFSNENDLDTHRKRIHLTQEFAKGILKAYLQTKETGAPSYSTRKPSQRGPVQVLHQSVKCTRCGGMFEHATEFQAHITSCTPRDTCGDTAAKKYFACNTCGKIVEGRSTLEEHRVIHSESSVEDSLEKHKMGDGSYRCALCLKIFRWKNSFKRHMVDVHTNPVTHTCVKCKQTFKSLSGLTAHLQTHLQDSQNSDVVCLSPTSPNVSDPVETSVSDL